MAAAFGEAQLRSGMGSADFAVLIATAARPLELRVTADQVDRYRSDKAELGTPAHVLYYAGKAVQTTVDELVAHVTGDRGALTRRIDELEREVGQLHHDYERLSTAVHGILRPEPRPPPDRPIDPGKPGQTA